MPWGGSKKDKADHDQLEACVRCPQGDEHFAHTLPECTQGESHPRRTINTQDDLSLSHMHRPTGQTTHWHPFVDRIMEANIPLGWKSLNLEQYDGITDLDKHLDAFLTQVNLYTNGDVILCRVFPMSLKGKHWPGTVDFLHDPLTTLTLLSSASVCNMQLVGHIGWHWRHWPSCNKQMMNLSRNSRIGLDALLSKSTISLHSMLLALRPHKVEKSLYKKPYSSRMSSTNE